MPKRRTKLKQGVPQEVLWRLDACDGYLDLGMLDRARQELDRVTGPSRNSTPFQQAELRLLMESKDWPAAGAAARHLRDLEPGEPAHWVQLAYAIRRAESIEAARAILLEAAARFPKVAVIPHNLACYECRLGRPGDAMTQLECAFGIDPGCRDLAREDEDLRPLWPALEG